MPEPLPSQPTPESSQPRPVAVSLRFLEWLVLFIALPILATVNPFGVGVFAYYTPPVIYVLAVSTRLKPRWLWIVGACCFAVEFATRPLGWRGAGFLPLIAVVYPYAVIVLLARKRPASRFDPVKLLARFVGVALVVGAGVYAFLPEQFLSFPRQRPGIFLLVMVLYPLVSALPQEIMFRSFYFVRYKELFRGDAFLAVSSVAVFGLLHLPFPMLVLPAPGLTVPVLGVQVTHIPITVALSLVAGYFFTSTYLSSRHLGYTWLEHALYGNFIFAIGLGTFFFRSSGG